MLCKIIYLGIFFLISLIYVCRSSDNDWRQPNGWGKMKNLKTNLNSNEPKDNCNRFGSKSDISLIYFQKFIKFLFDRKKMEYNEITKSFELVISLKLSEIDLEQLENSKDPRDWDTVLTETLLNSQIFNTKGILYREETWIEFLFDNLRFFFTYFLTSEIRLLAIILPFIFIILYVNRKFGYGLFITTLGFMFLTGFLVKYNECIKNLEIQEFIDGMQNIEDPCASLEDNEQNKKNWNIFNFKIFGSKKVTVEDCAIYLRNKNKMKLPLCRPDKVFLSFCNELILDQFSEVAEKITLIIKSFSDRLTFPYNIVAIVSVCLIFPLFLKLVFEYFLSPRVWMNFIRTSKNNEENTKSQEDRLSGENLKIFLETLSRQESIESKSKIVFQGSCVEILPSNPLEKRILCREMCQIEKSISNHSAKSTSDDEEEPNEMNSINEEIVACCAIENVLAEATS